MFRERKEQQQVRQQQQKQLTVLSWFQIQGNSLV